MILTTRKKTYRKVSNSGHRTNITVLEYCDFDNIESDDALEIFVRVIYCSKKDILSGMKAGFRVARVFNNNHLMEQRMIIKTDTLREIVKDFTF